MSEEIAAADSLLCQNAQLSRWIGEQNTTIGYQDAKIADLESTNALLIDRAMRQVALLHTAYDALLAVAYGQSDRDRAADVAAQILASLEELSD